MVKGISRQVIVVHAPDQKLFEQAIFIVREGSAACVAANDMEAHARKIVEDYVRRSGALPSGKKRRSWRISRAKMAIGFAALAWLAMATTLLVVLF